MHYWLVIILVSLWFVAISSAQTDVLDVCDTAIQRAAAQTVSVYKPSGLKTYIRLEEGHFWHEDDIYVVRGINYMPAQTPQLHFLIDTPDNVVRSDLGRFKAVGLNTVRIFLWHDGLFMCEGSGTVPLPGAVRFLDRFFKMAAEAGLRVIVTLNDQPDLENEPLYENPSLVWQQFEYLVARYANEPAILAWDVRSGGDTDYGANPTIEARFSQERVLAWLRRAVRTVKGLDANHPVTASWQFRPTDTLPYVDFVSVHRPASVDEARRHITELATSTKPVLLVGFGQSTYERSEAEQSSEILSYVVLAEQNNLLGWMVWQAFDFPVNRICQPMPCRENDGAELHEGLWQSSSTPKIAVEQLKLYLNAAKSVNTNNTAAEVLEQSVATTPTSVAPVFTPLATPGPTPLSTQQTRAIPRPLRL